MNFERGKSPMDSMEIGLRADAKEIWAIFLKDKNRTPEGSLEEGLIRLNSENIPGILESLKDDPDKTMQYTFDQIHDKGLISGPHELCYEMLGYVKFKNKYYWIPEMEDPFKKILNNVVNA